jgi:hypothetical protein
MKKPFSMFLATLMWVLPATAQQSATPAAPAPTQAAAQVSDEGPEVLASTDEAAAMIRQTLETDFTEMLPFPLTEEKMVAFTQAALRVEKINSKWDVQIASVESDKMAMEYNLFAIEEINNSLKSITGITADEYQIMTALTLEDKKFNKIYQAYRHLVRDKYFPDPVPNPAVVPEPQKPEAKTAGKIAVPTPAGTAALPGVDGSVTPRAAPASSGNAPMPQGSPTPPYSKP